jgi:hypothetical protein
MTPETAKKIIKSGWEVKNVKTFLGREGQGFNATIYRNGKKVGFAIDDASGGMVDLDFNTKEDEKAFSDFAATISEPWEYGDEPFVYNADVLAGALVEIKEDMQRCKKHMVIRLASAPQEIMIFNGKYEPTLLAYAQKKYGEDLLEIVNERYMK